MNSKDKSGTEPRISHRSLVGIFVGCLLLIGVVTTLSMQTGQAQKAKTEPPAPERRAPMANGDHRNYVTSNASGLKVVLDRQTGQTRPLTQDESERLAQGIKQLINQSSDGLVQVTHEDGSVSMDLEGRFQNVMLAKKEADGTVTQDCVDNRQAAAAFFEIDPKLVADEASTTDRQSTIRSEGR